MSLSPAFLDELKSRVTLSTLIGRTVKLTKSGREFKGCCPVHNEKTASFYVNDDKGFAHCFGCAAHFDAIKWMTDQCGLPFIDAVKDLAAGVGMEVPAPTPQAAQKAARIDALRPALEAAQVIYIRELEHNGKVREWLAARGIGPDEIAAFGIGYAPRDGGLRGSGIMEAAGIGAGLLFKRDALRQAQGERDLVDCRFRDRITVPIRDARGRIISFGARQAPGNDHGGKWINGTHTDLFDKGRVVFNADRAAMPLSPTLSPEGERGILRKRVLIVEGYFDCMALAKAGHGRAVAPMGTAITEEQLTRIWRLDAAPVVMLDGDKAGVAAAERMMHRALAHPQFGPHFTLNFAALPAGQDPDDLVQSAGEGALAAIDALITDALPMNAFLWKMVNL